MASKLSETGQANQVMMTLSIGSSPSRDGGLMTWRSATSKKTDPARTGLDTRVQASPAH